jgi:hypothetical protein
MVSGSGTTILVDTSRPLPQLKLLRWFTSLRHFLQTINATITMDYASVIPVQRQQDVHLIDFFMNQSIYSPLHLGPLNACRLYLKVLLLSDIVTPAGSEIYAQCFRRSGPTWNSTRGLYPLQPCPSKSAWDIWHRYLRLLTHPKSYRLNLWGIGCLPALI